ncbi:MAG: hypothetical protein QFF03_03075 [Pseudomonadota bacterium]|nr:hypothetical protein [Pseudomonadota bacterium]
MLQQIISHTPAYVWAILAFLIYRGLSASADREVEFSKLFIIPAVMLALSLQDLAGKFGLSGTSMAAWAAGAVVSTALTWKLGANRVVAGKRPGSVMLRGSWVPLTLMMSVFCTKYTVAVLLAMQPQARQDVLVVVLVSSLFGLINGMFFGRLARDSSAWQQVQARSNAATAATAAA